MSCLLSICRKFASDVAAPALCGNGASAAVVMADRMNVLPKVKRTIGPVTEASVGSGKRDWRSAPKLRRALSFLINCQRAHR